MSIRTRSALWHGSIFGVTFVIFSLALYILMAQHLENMVQDAAAGESEHIIAAILAANRDDVAGETVTIPPLEVFQSSELYFQVMDTDGAILARSPNLGDRTIPTSGSVARQTDTQVIFDGVRMKLYSTPLTIGGETSAWVQVAGSYRQRDLVLVRLRWVLIGGGLAAFAFVGLFTRLLASKTLSPVSEMSETARAIALSKGFDRRLSVSNPADELGQLAQTFNEMLASLENAYSAQQRFTADASHELRAPLTAIQGNLDILDRIKAMPEQERNQTLSQVRREVERLSRLVNDLLLLARADAGQSLRVGPVEADTLLLDVHREALAMSDGVDVRLEYLEPAVVQGDEDRLKEVLLTLVDNAIHYTPRDGRVTLGLGSESSWITMWVEDTGMGIEPDALPHIFERFWRADRARSRDRGGTGLGLSIANWIVRQHGGEFVVESEPGKGSRFTVRLPLYEKDGRKLPDEVLTNGDRL